MTEILKNQTLEVENLFSFRGKVNQMELENIGKDMEERVNLAGAKKTNNPITETYSVDGI